MQHQQPSVSLPVKTIKNIVALMEILNPVVRDFILFCIQRQGKEWPALYDEMCWVCGHHTFRGLGYAELRNLGLSFSLTNIDNTIRMVDTVTAQG